MQGNWTLGVLIGVPIYAIVIVGLVITTIVLYVRSTNLSRGWREKYRAKDDIWDARLDGLIDALFPLIGVVAVVALAAITYFPYQKEYHYWAPVSGQVQEIDKRLLGDGDKGMSERYVFTIDGQPYGVDDTRATTVRKGDTVQLSCKKEWQWQSTPGWGCRWVGKESK